MQRENLRFENEVARLVPTIERDVAPVAALPFLGDYDLRRGDNDSTKKWAGKPRKAPEPLPASGARGFVAQLQRALLDFGIRIRPSVTGVFDVRTELAVREFQIYVKCLKVAKVTNPRAQRYVDRLSAVKNDYMVTLRGPVSGILDAGTRALVGSWIQEGYRCPVVIDALDKDRNGNFTVVRRENLWWRDDFTGSNARMFARDFSGTYSLPPGRRPEDPIQLGDFGRFGSEFGPRSDRPGFGDQWPEAEISRANLFGAVGLSAATQSSFRVMRAVSEVESIGFFDAINAYDNVFISQGPFHQPIGAAGDKSGGELGSILSELEAKNDSHFLQAFGQYGIKATKEWNTNGSALFAGKGSRRYACTLSFEGDGKQFKETVEAEKLNYLRSWHWFYRWAMAGRTVQGYREAFWRGARHRIREMLSTEWEAGAAGRSGVRVAGPLIGDFYTSERAVALILRWHVRFPAHMIDGGHAGLHLKNAFLNARLNGKKPSQWGPPASWTNDHETALIAALMARVAVVGRPGFTQTMNAVNRDGSLSSDRGSFQLDRDSLSMAPP